MAIRLAFSTVACPDWTIDKVVQQAAEMGYEGVELRTLGPGGSGLASDPMLSKPDTTRGAFEAQGIVPVCLSTSWSVYHDDPSVCQDAFWQIKHSLEWAAQIGCSCVRVFGYEVGLGLDRSKIIERLAERVSALADVAGSLGVQLLLENTGPMAASKPWWWLLNVVDHPMVGLCWNVANAAAVGESPSVSVPMLNSRIRLAKVKDTQVGQGSGFVPLGDGTVGIQSFLKRLLGVGYDGFVTVEWDRLWLASLASAQTYLPDARQRLSGWLDTISQAQEKGRAVAEKAAAKNAPKPRAKAG